MKALFLAICICLSSLAIANEKPKEIYVVAVEDDQRGGGTIHMIACGEPVSVVLSKEDLMDQEQATEKLMVEVDKVCGE